MTCPPSWRRSGRSCIPVGCSSLACTVGKRVSKVEWHLTYMIDIALRTEFALAAGGARSAAADRVIRWSTAFAVLGVAAVAAVASYEHAYELVRAHGETGWTAHLIPLTVDGLIYASSMVVLDAPRRRAPVPSLARWLLGLGIAATLAANMAQGWATARSGGGRGLAGGCLVGKVADCAIFARFCRARFGCWEGIRLLGAR